jgi:methylated-DNA-[protein]-cysteine S-methyltransferase
MVRFKYDLFETPIGWIGLLASDKGLRKCALKPTPDQVMTELSPEVDEAEQDEEALAHIRRTLEEYSCGDRVSLDDITLDTSDVTPFFGLAWEACRRIPAGETRSYKWLAIQAGHPNAPRAAGQAMARNRFALIVPCHRVIASDGGLGGYGGGGLGVKKRLLDMERANTAKTRD